MAVTNNIEPSEVKLSPNMISVEGSEFFQKSEGDVARCQKLGLQYRVKGAQVKKVKKVKQLLRRPKISQEIGGSSKCYCCGLYHSTKGEQCIDSVNIAMVKVEVNESDLTENEKRLLTDNEDFISRGDIAHWKKRHQYLYEARGDDELFRHLWQMILECRVSQIIQSTLRRKPQDKLCNQLVKWRAFFLTNRGIHALNGNIDRVWALKELDALARKAKHLEDNYPKMTAQAIKVEEFDLRTRTNNLHRITFHGKEARCKCEYEFCDVKFQSQQAGSDKQTNDALEHPNKITEELANKPSSTRQQKVLGIGAHSGSINEVCSIPSRFKVVNWRANDIRGKLLTEFEIRPDLCEITPQGEIYHTNLSYYSDLHQYWRGDLNYDLEIISTKVHQGQLFVVWVPPGVKDGDVDLESYINVPSTTIDVSEQPCTRIKVPFTAPSQWKRTVSRRAHYVHKPEFSTLGRLKIFVQNSLVCPDMVAQNVVINIYSSAGSNFKFSVPRNPTSYRCRVNDVNDVRVPIIKFQSKNAPIDDFRKTNDMGNSRSIREQISLDPHNGNNTGFENFSNMNQNMKAVKIFSGGFDTSVAPYVDIARIKFPQAFMDNDKLTISGVSQYNYYSSMDFEMEIRIPPTMFHQGALIVFFVPEAYGSADPTIRRFTRGTVMNFPHCVINMCGETKKSFKVPFASMFDSYYKGSTVDMKGTIVVQVWNQLQTGPNMSPKIEYSLWCTPMNVKMGFPIPKWQSADGGVEQELVDLPQGKDNRADYLVDRVEDNMYSQLTIPAYVDTQDLVDVHQYPQFVGARHWWLRAPFAYSSGGNELTLLGDADKTFKGKVAVQLITQEDKMMTKTEFDPQSVKLAAAEISSNPRTTFWFPQESNKLTVKIPQNDIFPIQRQNMANDTVKTLPSWIQMVAMTKENAEMKPTITVLHQVQPDFKLYMLGGMPITYTRPAPGPTPTFPPGWVNDDNVPQAGAPGDTTIHLYDMDGKTLMLSIGGVIYYSTEKVTRPFTGKYARVVWYDEFNYIQSTDGTMYGITNNKVNIPAGWYIGSNIVDKTTGIPGDIVPIETRSGELVLFAGGIKFQDTVVTPAITSKYDFYEIHSNLEITFKDGTSRVFVHYSSDEISHQPLVTRTESVSLTIPNSPDADDVSDLFDQITFQGRGFQNPTWKKMKETRDRLNCFKKQKAEKEPCAYCDGWRSQEKAGYDVPDSWALHCPVHRPRFQMKSSDETDDVEADLKDKLSAATIFFEDEKKSKHYHFTPLMMRLVNKLMKNLEGKSQIKIVDANSEWNEIHNSDFIALTTQQKFRRGELFEVLAPKEQTTVYIEPIRGAPSKLIEALCHYLKFRTNIPIVVATQNRAMKRRILEREWTYGQVVIHYGGNRVKAFCEVDFDESVKDQMIKSSFNIRKTYREIDQKGHRVNFIKFQGLTAENSLNAVTVESFKSGIAGFANMIFGYMKSMGISVGNLIMSGINKIRELIVNVVGKFIVDVIKNVFGELWTQAYDWIKDNLITFFVVTLFLTLLITGPKMALAFITVLGGYYFYAKVLEPMIRDFMNEVGEAITFMALSDLMDTVKTKFSGMTEKQAKLFTKIVGLSVVSIFTTITTVSVPKGPVQSILQNVSARACYDSVSSMIYSVGEIVAGYFTPDDDDKMKMAANIVEKYDGLGLMKQFDEFEQNDCFTQRWLDHRKEGYTPRECIFKAQAFYTEIAPLCEELKKLEDGPYLFKQVNRVPNIYKKLTKISDLSATRSEPVGIWFAGEAGVGKSLLLSECLPKMVVMGLNLATGETAGKHIYSIPMDQDQKYYDGYANQIYSYLDDFSARNDGEDYNNILQLISTSIAPLPMAELGDKGTVFTSEFVAVSSNQYQVQSTKVFKLDDPFIRRFPISYKVVVKKEFNLTEGQIDLEGLPVAQKLDFKKFTKHLAEKSAAGLTMDQIFNDVWTFKPLNLSTGFVHTRNDNIRSEEEHTCTEVLRRILETYKSRKVGRATVAKQTNTLKVSVNIANIEDDVQPWEPQDLYRKAEELGVAKDVSKVSDNQVREVLTGVVRLSQRGEIVQIKEAIKNNLAVQQEQVEEIVKEVEYPSDDLPQFKGLKPEFQSLGSVVAKTGISAAGKYLARKFRVFGYSPIMTKAIDLDFGTKPGTLNLDIKGFWDDWIGGVSGMQCRKQLKSEEWYDYVRKLEGWLDKNTKWSGSAEDRPWVFPHKTTQFLKDTFTQQEFDAGIINCYCLHASLYIRENETDHRPGMYVYEPETLGTGFSGDGFQRCWRFVDYVNKHARSLDQQNLDTREKQWISIADALQVQACVVNEFLIVPPKLSFWGKARKWATPVLKIGLTIFTIHFCVKILTSLMSGFFSMLGFNAGEAAYTKKGKIPKMKVDKTHLPKFQGLDQGILNKIKAATVKIYHPTTQKFISHALILDQRFLAVNKHVLDGIIDDGMFSFYLRCPTSRACLHVPFRGQMSRGVHLGKDTDTVIIKTPQPIPRASNIAKYLSSMTTMQAIAGEGFTFDVHHLVPSGKFEVRKVIPGQLRKFHDVDLYWVEEGTLPVYDGDCGSPYMTPGSVLGNNHVILGIHAAGINGRSHSAFFSPLSMNMYNEARRELDKDGMALHVETVDFQARNMVKLESVDQMNPNFRQMGQISGLNPYTEIIPEDCLDDQRISTPPNRDGLNAIESYGACSINGNHICNGQITTSEIRKSKIHSKEIWNDGFEPAKLDVNILLDRFTVYNRPNTQNVPRDMYEWCIKEYFDQMKTITVDVERRPLTTDEVLNVSSAYPHTFPFDRNSSAGFWNVVSMKKKDLIDGIIKEDEEGVERNHFTLKDTKVHPWIKKTLKQHIADEEESIRKGNQMFTFWNATLKDELRSHEKVAAGRTRQFQSGSFDHSFLCKKYYGAFADWFRSNPGFTLMHGIGNDKDSCWSYYHKRLMEMGGNGFDIDGKDYGVSINGQASQFFQEVTELWYKQSDLWNEGDQKARGGIMEAVRHSMHIVAAYLCGTTTGNNDGFFLTDVYNSITNIFYQLVAFCGSYKMKYGVLPEHGLYMKNVRTLTYGDDVIHGVSSWALEFFNRQTCAEWMNPMGIVITSAAKTAGLEKFNKIEDLTFLKSAFVAEKSVVRAPMPEGVIFKELNWYKKTCEDARLIRRDICHSAIAHASHHPEDFYNNLISQINGQIEKQDPELIELFKPKPYDQMIQELSFKQDMFNRSMNGRDNYKHEEEKPIEEGLKFFDNIQDYNRYKNENPQFQYLNSIRHEEGEEEIGIVLTVLWRSFLAHANISMAIFINTLFFFLLAPLHAKMSLTILKRRWLTFSSTARMHPVYHVVAPINEEIAFDRPYEKVIFGFVEFVDYVNKGVSVPIRLPALVLHLFNAYLMNNGGHLAVRVFLHMCFNVCASFYEVRQLSDDQKRQELRRCYLALPKTHPLKPVLSELMKEL